MKSLDAFVKAFLLSQNYIYPMKKIMVSIGLFLLAMGAVLAQCTPDQEFNGTGLTFAPNQLAPVYTCAGCGDQVRVISIQTFTDTTLSVELAPGNPPLDVQVFADFFRLDSIAGLPEGLTYTTDAAFDTTFDAVENPFGYWINPGDTTNGFENTTGCVSIEGAEADWNAAIGGGPNNDGVYPLTLFIDARAANFDPAAIGGVVGFNTWLTEMGSLLDAFGDPNFTVNGIRLMGPELVVTESGVGINEANRTISDFRVYPNPLTDESVLSFQSREAGIGTLQIVDVTGKLLISESVTVQMHQNQIKLGSIQLEQGVYLASLSMPHGTVSTTFVVR